MSDISDARADARQGRSRVKIPAVVVPAGQDPGPLVRGVLSDPVRLTIQIRQREDANQPSEASGQPQPEAATSQPEPADPAANQPNNPNAPAGPSGDRSMAPRRPPQQNPGG
jgi:hypothetical protein